MTETEVLMTEDQAEELNFKNAMIINNDFVEMLKSLRELNLSSQLAKSFRKEVLEYIDEILKRLHNSKIQTKNEASASKNKCCENLTKH